MKLAIPLACVVMIAGCGTKGPTYNEALQTYENEMRVTERLMDEKSWVASQAKEETNQPADGVGSKRPAMFKGMDNNAENYDREIKEQLRRVDKAKAIVDELQRSK